MAGLHWYHPHKHHYTYETVKGGAYGLLLVEETKENLKQNLMIIIKPFLHRLWICFQALLGFFYKQKSISTTWLDSIGTIRENITTFSISH